MRDWIFVAVVLLAFTAGCSKSEAQQTGASGAERKTSPPAAASKKLPALNKTASGEKIAFSVRIPSDWDFSVWFDDMDNEYYLVIDPEINGLNVSMSVHQGFERSLSNNHYSVDEDFVFADRRKGFYKKSDKLTVFVNVSEYGTLYFCIDHGGYEGGAKWYNENEELIREVAKTLTFTGTLVSSGFGDYVIYVLPAFEYKEEGAQRIVAPRAGLQSQFLKDNKMFIYPVKEGSPVPSPSEEYRKNDGVTIRSEFAHYKIGEDTFEVKFMFPLAAIEDGLVMMKAMANSMRPAE